MSTSTSYDHLNALKTAEVLVIGDIMLDRFVSGTVERISPESPVPVLSIKREENMLGGAGNALANLAGLYAKANIFSVIGNDSEGETIKEHIKTLGYDTDDLLSLDYRPTIVKTRFLAGHQQLLRADAEVTSPVSQHTLDKILEKIEKKITQINAVLISDYGKGLLQPLFLQKVIEISRANNIPVIIDPKGADYSRYTNADIITPNKKELSEATGGMSVETDAEIIAAAKSLIEKYSISNVLATRSAQGMSFVPSNGKAIHIPSRDIEVFDVSGAGDTVISVVAAALASGISLEHAAKLANIAGGIVVTKVGTAPIRYADLEKALADDVVLPVRAAGKSGAGMLGHVLFERDSLIEKVKQWRARRLRVGFTNGCFDILHAGHVNYLVAAKDECDRLIVGLNSDASVRILKGETRPIHDQNARATVLSGLSSVDALVFFGAENEGEDNTATSLLNALKPDVYFKGGDYTLDQIPEAPVVQSYGGKVHIMDAVEGYSTTIALEKLKA